MFLFQEVLLALLFSASRYEFLLFCQFEDCNENGHLPLWIQMNNSIPTPNMPGQNEVAMLLFNRVAPKNQTVYFSLKSINHNNRSSDVSNFIPVSLDESTETPTTKDPTDVKDNKAGKMTIRAIVGGSVFGLFLLICIAVSIHCFAKKVRRSISNNTKDIPKSEFARTQVSETLKNSNTDFRDGSLRRVESFPVMLYTHDQIKDVKKKKERYPPLYKAEVSPKPWMSLDTLSRRSNKENDKSDDSTSTIPVTDANSRSHLTEMKQLYDNTPSTSQLHLEKVARF